MDPISSTDRLAALLRQRLAERNRAEGGGRREGQRAAGDRSLDRVEAVGAMEDRRGRGARRLLVETILATELGGALQNEAGFQQVVDRVVDALEADEAAAALLVRALDEAAAKG